MNFSYNRSYFFDKGIRFECQKCGACCTGEPGTIYVARDEVSQIAHFLNISENAHLQEYLYPFRDSYSVREAKDGDCLFFKDGCTIYPVRPSQCRDFPFWLDNLRSENNWRKVSAECPGIGKGRLFQKDEILSILEKSAI